MIRRTVALASLLVLIAAPAAAIDDVTVSELDALPGNYQDEEVVLVGEVVGDYAFQATQVWIQVNDDRYISAPLLEAGLAGTNSGIGVLIHADRFDHGWGEPGGYRVRGPIVRVTGIFRYNHASEMGETYIEATSVELIEPSRPIQDETGLLPAILGAVFILAAAAIHGFGRRRVGS